MTAPRELEVAVNGSVVGHLREANDLWAFQYTTNWVDNRGTYDLSPTLVRRPEPYVDGASLRPVQWYFDNLLPEELLRTVLAKEANLPADDAFGLLAYFGAESAGSLTLRAPNAPPAEEGLRELPLAELSARIANLPNASLVQGAPKQMSLAGAQHKLVVVRQDGQLFEPLPGTPSTHILKPNSLAADYPATVINEYFSMRLAHQVGLDVPEVAWTYVPQPVYLVRRFDRAGSLPCQRLHAIDTCQLLNKSRGFKYSAANLGTLNEAIAACRTKALARQQLYRWLLFNVLIGNGDNHLKNLSFLVTAEGIRLSPAYDLLSTGVYSTRALAPTREKWPNEPLALSLEGAQTFAEITRAGLISAGEALGLPEATAARELDRMRKLLPSAADTLLGEIDAAMPAAVQRSPDPNAARLHCAGELRLLRTIRHVVLHDMLARSS